ncbi:type IV secretion system DNA-binding domain-containing protein, partial [Candidatus Poribacteria bacterium]|nr:type IV secretion system DNA-binding domain-containing protein [Candidatus Poribacteria bacterium]
MIILSYKSPAVPYNQTMLPYSIGITDIHKEPFQISPKHKQRHVSIFGKSGVGKTTMLCNMVTWDIYHRLGVTVIDPHGGLIEEILQTIPRERTNDVIYINPQDPKRAIGMNIFEAVSEEQKPLVVSSVISIMKNIWADNWGPRTEYILSNVSFALLSQPKPQTLIAIPKLLTDKDFRERIVDNISDPVVRDFFDQYDNRWSSRFREEAIAPLLN